jgi:hypothetical protein
MRSHLPRPLDVFSIEDESLTVAKPEYLLCYEDRAVFFDAYGRRSRSFDLKWSRFAFRIGTEHLAIVVDEFIT